MSIVREALEEALERREVVPTEVTGLGMMDSWDDEFVGLPGALRRLHRWLFERPRGGGSGAGADDGMGLAEGAAIADADWGGFGDFGGW